jgi:hypothetical protein
LRKKEDGTGSGNAAKVDVESLLGSVTTLLSDASTKGISSRCLPNRRKKPSNYQSNPITKKKCVMMRGRKWH